MLPSMTDSEILDKLGGTTKVAQALGCSLRVVSNWRRPERGISRAGRYQIRDLAKQKRIALPPDFMER
jgi:hypothetical protein